MVKSSDDQTQTNQRCGCGQLAADDIRYSGMCTTCYQIDCALECAEQAPAEKFCLSIYLIASDGSHDVFINSEQDAENLVRILDMNLIDYIELYRVHDVPEDTSPYEYLRNMQVSQ